MTIKKPVSTALCAFIMISFSYGQARNASGIIAKLSTISDQFNDQFDPSMVSDSFTIMYIPGKNNVFAKVYDKYAGKQFADNVLFVGGFKQMMASMSEQSKKGHLQDALSSRYDRESITVLIDLQSEISEVLPVNGFTILTISKKANTITSTEYGDDRLAFFTALDTYLK